MAVKEDVMVGMSAEYAQKLLDDKLAEQYRAIGKAEQEARQLQDQTSLLKDQVAEIAKDRDALKAEIEKLKASKDAQLKAIEEHRANVQRSLEDTEAKLKTRINKASEAEQQAQEIQAAAAQSEARVIAIKSDLERIVSTFQKETAQVFTKVAEALKALA